MDEPATGRVTSADGTTISYDRCGTGTPVVLVHGAFTDRTHPLLREVAAALSPWFTVYNYDRRGRGTSGDGRPYAVEREVEDLAALLAEAGGPAGPAMVFGGSSGAALALRAAAAGLPIGKLALWEPPYHVGPGTPDLPARFAERLESLVREGRRGDAVELFMVRAAEVPAEAVAAMRAGPGWAGMEALAHTLAYEAAVMSPRNALPAGPLAAISRPTLVLNGGASPRWMLAAGHAVAAAVPGAEHRVLEGETHAVSSRALAPELLEFFVAA
ncbi:alpha/beta hydrolase [Nonomuraea roseoviolacea subsp. roseoviolacea]|uniref:Alpha-beta hydrolase superfamily lysophospholipase n=1 Tax=Nonomuraea roseoviolacea subsp. carminata TaxID=160689 RepID=A0ABT1K7Q3_9ACTN|nr:alpha/beta hydrolase [Nonomuraea roseoviolacea]MCP2349642.1 alpha-beta hydrolase superfamily lysophospholipase [Nonomuraea roseoviolacea subsp. carminata]